jgi:AraC family transcriptional regulator
MAGHHHTNHQFSCLLAGELLEGHAGQEQEICLPSLGVKPAGLTHFNQYGPDGALILTINLEPAQLEDYLPDCSIDWRWKAGGLSGRDRQSALAISRLARATPADAESLACDLLAVLTPGLASSGNVRSGGAVPAWLARARDALREGEAASDLKQIADEAGVHRVHLSRAFSGQFGIAPSLYRRHCRLARAISDMLDGTSLADAAMGAGFADQSHFSRLARRQTGFSPNRLKTLLAAA